ncbi:arginase family enzyme [Haloactinomyces albus]|uniref:Arginase family enzyme n=1 Tax=Haloactinomyces albus TaxID=1352928 RepID=A0AAE3ZJ77_9ACTN|nr:arginase family protein [Haloactinomyces albus]MDR7304624.1 arginase family enzyme [Haloactinomyces albus]
MNTVRSGLRELDDRTLSTFARSELPHFAGERGTFLKSPFTENVHDIADVEVAIFGVPLDAGATYRPGARFGPRGIRRATNLFGTYSYELRVDLREQLNVVDIGDVLTIPGNLEKSFDIEVLDAGFVPGTGWPEPGGLLPARR